MNTRLILSSLALLLSLAAGARESLTAPHPRLFADADDFAALKSRLSETELGRRGRDALLNAADDCLKAPEPVYRKDASGMRILSVSRKTIAEIGKLALAYRLTGRREYAAKAIAQARAAAAFSDWNPSHFLDTAEMTFAEALCYDWLYDTLSDEDRTALSQAILSKGLLNAKGGLASGWWTKGDSNWTQVCHGGLVAGAIAIAEIAPDVSRQIVDRAVACLPIPMAVFAPDGGFPEGAGGYWQYAMEYNILAIWAIEKADGTDHGLSSRPGFSAEVDFLDACTGPTGLFFNFSDGGTKRAPCFAQWWLAQRFNRPDTLTFREAAALRAEIARMASYDRLFPFLLLSLRDPQTDRAVRSPRARVIRGVNPIAVMRTSWNDPEAWYVGLKGGRASYNHGHMDVGSFVLDAKGVRWVHDLGCESYSRVEAANIRLWDMKQQSPRWDLFRYSLRGHGTLQFGDERQNVTATAEFTPLAENTGTTSTTLDLSAVYGRTVRRTFTLGKAGGFTVSDAIRGAHPGERVTWRINTFADVRTDGHTARLTAKTARGETRQMILTAEPADLVFEAIGHETREHDYESDNPGLRQLQFTGTAPASGALDFKVTFE